MSRRITISLVVIVAVVAAIQVVRPSQSNPPTEPQHAIQAHVGNVAAVAVISRACRDCHTHDTTWPWYSQVAPVSWLVARDVNEGRKALNFSRWVAYGAERQQKLLRESCEAVSKGEMPIGIYAMLHADARLTKADTDAICALAPRERSSD